MTGVFSERVFSEFPNIVLGYVGLHDSSPYYFHESIAFPIIMPKTIFSGLIISAVSFLFKYSVSQPIVLLIYPSPHMIDHVIV